MQAIRHRFIALTVAAGLALALAGAPTSLLACGDPDLLAMDLNNEVLPPPALVASIATDLATIRAQHRMLADIHCFPSWEWGRLLAKLTPEAFAAFTAGTYTGLDALNAQYDATGMSVLWFSSRVINLTFDSCFDYNRLAAAYAEHADVEWAAENGIGGDGDDIDAESNSTYVFSRGWGDCMAGCTYRHYWRVRVASGQATVLDDWGSPYSGSPVTGSPPAARVALPQNVPNPFNPCTTIAFALAEEGRSRLDIFDAAGRHVRGLVDGVLPAGGHEVSWDGRDDAGRNVGSGTYRARLESGGAAAEIRITLLR